MKNRLFSSFFILFGLLSLFYPITAHSDITDEECLSCHTDSTKVKKIYDPEPLKSSVHEDLECIECHETITKAKHDEKLPKVNCGGCHDEEEDKFKGSIHGSTNVTDEEIKPTCAACHGTHDVLKSKNSKSKTNVKNISQTCAHCHSEKKLIEKVSRLGLDPVAGYEHSVHNHPQKDNPKKLAATCIDCHSAHEILGPANPGSSVNKFNIPATCGKCHEKESKEFKLSVHWKSVNVFGHYEAPVCNDCHGEHQPIVPGKKDTTLNESLESSQLCSNCHSNTVLMSRFGLDARRFDSYMKTYHGLAAMRGSPDAAKCISCHEVHAIREQKDPESSVNKAQLKQTCSKCHENSNDSFINVAVHPVNQQDRNPIAYYIKLFYVVLIISCLGGMLLHNAIILFYYLKLHWKEKKSQPQVTRFSLFQVIQHFLLFISFTVLAITGFALKYPDAWWVNFLAFVGMDEGIRSLIHRISAVLLVVISVLQFIYFIGSRAGRKDMISLIPRFSDIADFWNTMRFYLFNRDERPKGARYDYAEKVEYLALIWGVIIMAATGFVLWFPEFFMQYLPVWVFEVSEVIHFFEAILAVSAIIIWHFFFTILHPERYPMNTTWIDGKVTHQEEEHHRKKE